jgi:hypothetical protein
MEFKCRNYLSQSPADEFCMGKSPTKKSILINQLALCNGFSFLGHNDVAVLREVQRLHSCRQDEKTKVKDE